MIRGMAEPPAYVMNYTWRKRLKVAVAEIESRLDLLERLAQVECDREHVDGD
jgi:hypothetical protein